MLPLRREYFFAGDKMDLTETQIDTQMVYEGGFIQVHKDRVRLPDGSVRTREYIGATPLGADSRCVAAAQNRDQSPAGGLERNAAAGNPILVSGGRACRGGR